MHIPFKSLKLEIAAVCVMGDAVRELEEGPLPLLAYKRGNAQKISLQNFALPDCAI